MSKEKTTVENGNVGVKGINKLNSDYVIDGSTAIFYKSVLELTKSGKCEKYEFTSTVEFPRSRVNGDGKEEDRDDLILFVLKSGGYVIAKMRHNKS
jgi:hypothetical protein